jgi:transposase
MSRRELDRLGVMERVARGDLSQVEAARMCGRSERQIRRWLGRYRQQGEAGLTSRRRGRPSNNRLSDSLRRRIIEIVASRYEDFGPTLANEKLHTEHDIEVSTESVRQLMTQAGMWRPRSRRGGRLHPLRERRARRGELVQIDGSPHDWFEARGERCTLIVFIDDATSELLAMEFWPQETTAAYMSTLRLHLHQHGRAVSYYSDRHGIFRPPQDVDEPKPTQFGRALKALDIESIQASSPQAKGRVERVNRLLQDRLVKEMRLQGIDNIEAANDYLPRFIEQYNQRFAKPPRIDLDAHREVLHSEQELDLLLSFQDERAISKNLEVRFENSVYQLQAGKRRRRLSGKRAVVHKHYDGRISILVADELIEHKIFAQGEAPTPLEDEKTLNARVDMAVNKTGAKKYKPPQTHPWKRKPHSEKAISRQEVANVGIST